MTSEESMHSIPGTISKAEENKIVDFILDLRDPQKREQALDSLSKIRDNFPDFAIWLWFSYGTMAILLQEVVDVYPAISPPALTAQQSNRVCNALAIMRCVAAHKDTRGPFLQASIPLYLYPFLNTTKSSRPFEFLRLTSLGVIGALVKTDDPEVIQFLISTELIPSCLTIMDTGNELLRTVATFILQKVLMDRNGLAYVCQTFERFSHVSMILGKMVAALEKNPSPRLLKHTIRCYHRLSDNPRALGALKQYVPLQLKDDTFINVINGDNCTRLWLAQFLQKLESVKT